MPAIATTRLRPLLMAAALPLTAAVASAAEPPPRVASDVCGPVAAGTTWTRAGSPYQSTCDVAVPAGVTLTIEPGVEVRLGTNHLINVDGALHAVGTADAPIRFVPSGAQPWSGIQLSTASGPSEIGHAVLTGGGSTRRREMLGIATDRALIHHTEITDSQGVGAEITGGASPTIRDSRFIRASNINANPPAALRIRGKSNAIVEDNFFASNDQLGVFWEADASPRFVGNRFEFNALDGVMVYGTVTREVVLPNLGPRRWPYRITRGGLNVDAGGKLTINAGATLRFAPGLAMKVRGTLAVRGAAGSKVRFTADQPRPSPGQWREIEFEPGSLGWDPATGSGSIIDHAEIEYGGSNPTGALLIRGSSPRISNTTIRASGQRGMTVTGPGARPELVGNLLADNLAEPQGAALFVSGQAGPQIAWSIFRNNVEGVHADAGATPRVGPHNWFDFNRSFAVVNDDRAVCLDAAGNDWGAVNGPRDPSGADDACSQGRHSGDGELVSDHVRFTPFEGRLTRPMLTGPRCGTTAETRPTITGFAAPGATVTVYDNYERLGELVAAAGEGEVAEFAFTPSEPLAAGSHVFQVLSRQGGLESGIANPLEISIDPGLVLDLAQMNVSATIQGTHYVQPFQDEAGCLTLRGDAEWNIRMHPGAPLTLAVPIRCSAGEAPAAEIEYRGAVIPLTPAAPGDDTHTATFDMADGGSLRLRATCGARQTELLVGTVTPERNGFIYNKAALPDPLLTRIPGAKVTLFVRDLGLPVGRQWVMWDGASYFGQTNPQTTGDFGWYAFYPQPGQYRVMVEAPGFDSAILTNEKISVEPIVQSIGLSPKSARKKVFLPWASRGL